MIACRRSVAGLMLLLSAAWAHGQPNYPQGYFRNPLDIPILLAGNFGECRPNHFHSGIDIKTEGRENLPVRAAADGYVSRIKTEPGGFGHALYITHPNGFTTLYAHLNNFNPALQSFLRKEQYRRESWTLDMPLEPGQFPVKQGDLIAYSGNTGGSTAPHLHLEIRDTKTEHPLNPQLFGFAINDTRPPVPQFLTLAYGTQPGGTGSPVYYPLIRQGNDWRAARPLQIMPDMPVMLGIVADDFMNGSDNTLNFYTAEWWLDDALQGRIRLDDIGYDVTRYLHAYIDYEARQRDNRWVQLLARLPGNNLHHIYEALNPDNGMIRIADSGAHQGLIVLTDAGGNGTRINVTIETAGRRNVSLCEDRQAGPGGQEMIYESISLRFRLPDSALYRSSCIPVYPRDGDKQANRQAVSQRFWVGLPVVPVHRYFPLFVKPNLPIPFALRDKLALRYSDGKQESGQAAAFDENGWYKADVRAFGDYWLVADTGAPKIVLKTPKPALGNASRILFDISDALTSVKTARAELDGQWILLEQHGTSWFYDADAHCPPGRHQLVIKATDQNGNERIAQYDFVRKG